MGARRMYASSGYSGEQRKLSGKTARLAEVIFWWNSVLADLEEREVFACGLDPRLIPDSIRSNVFILTPIDYEQDHHSWSRRQNGPPAYR